MKTKVRCKSNKTVTSIILVIGEQTGAFQLLSKLQEATSPKVFRWKLTAHSLTLFFFTLASVGTHARANGLAKKKFFFCTKESGILFLALILKFLTFIFLRYKMNLSFPTHNTYQDNSPCLFLRQFWVSKVCS